jgi:hypothetical protein
MAEHTDLDALVHHRILSHILDHGHAPDLPELAAALGSTDAAVEASLRRLAENHGLVLHPSSSRIWVIHPFALQPTPFWVSSARGAWWGNCAWCSLGIAALASGDVTIATYLGAEQERIEIHVRDGAVVEDELVVHFSIPVARAWDNVFYYCATVLVFRSEADIDRWCAQHRIDKGAIVPIRQAWELARAWYGNHLAPDWRKWTPAEAQSIFDGAGLTGSFWRVDQTAERF